MEGVGQVEGAEEIEAQLAGMNGDFGAVGALEEVGGDDRGGKFALEFLAAEHAVGEGVADGRRPEEFEAPGFRALARLVEDAGGIRVGAEREESGFGLADGNQRHGGPNRRSRRECPKSTHRYVWVPTARG